MSDLNRELIATLGELADEPVEQTGPTGDFVYIDISSIDREAKRPLVVSCGNQRRQSVVVVAPCGHVGKSQSGLSTCPCGLVVHELEAVS